MLLMISLGFGMTLILWIGLKQWGDELEEWEADLDRELSESIRKD